MDETFYNIIRELHRTGLTSRKIVDTPINDLVPLVKHLRPEKIDSDVKFAIIIREFSKRELNENKKGSDIQE